MSTIHFPSSSLAHRAGNEVMLFRNQALPPHDRYPSSLAAVQQRQRVPHAPGLAGQLDPAGVVEDAVEHGEGLCRRHSISPPVGRKREALQTCIGFRPQALRVRHDLDVIDAHAQAAGSVRPVEDALLRPGQ